MTRTLAPNSGLAKVAVSSPQTVLWFNKGNFELLDSLIRQELEAF
jgi:hypothetical protein